MVNPVRGKKLSVSADFSGRENRASNGVNFRIFSNCGMYKGICK